jgi:DNA helicase-2/ATP-dependent DNA helicase PcrA
VVDYKTGQPRTRNELEGVKPRGGHAPLRGKTKNATGDYKRQLVFYKLLLDELPTFSAKMVSGEIDFVEADRGGKFHKEKFLIDEAEAKALKELVTKTAEAILKLSFWEEGCGKRDCEFCQWHTTHAKMHQS